jgi:phosphoribosylamine--glycine ligase
VLAARGYPESTGRGEPILGLDDAAQLSDTVVFHAGTRRMPSGGTVTDGGRVLGVTTLGDTIAAAVDRAYAAVDRIHFDGMHFRRDIGRRAIDRETRGRDT